MSGIKRNRGFTLIELLIVIAIVSILSAIAFPNIRNAQIRSKVARVQSEMQSLATALETYKTDNNTYPNYNNPLDESIAYEHFIPLSLTTPIAYITSISPDIFALTNPRNGDPSFPLKQPFYYFSEDLSPGKVIGTLNQVGIYAPEAKWILWSYGPDLLDNEGIRLYDPSNGTTSIGDIERYGP